MPLVGRLAAARCGRRGAGEGALDVAEQLGFEQALGWSRRGRPRPSAGRRGATGGGSRARRSPCRCRSRRGSGHWRRSARRARSASGPAPSPRIRRAAASRRRAPARDARPRSIRASSLLRRSAAALRTVATSRSLLQGLATKSLAPRLIASTAIDDRAMGGDDHHRRLRVARHDPAEIVEALAAVGRAALEIEVEQDRRRATRASMQRQQLRAARPGSSISLEQVAQRQPRRQRDVGIVVDDDGKVERRIHHAEPSAIVRKRTVAASRRFGIWHARLQRCGHDSGVDYRRF